MSSGKAALKSGIWYTISNFALKGIDFLTIPLFARLMSQSEYGAYSNFVSWLQIILIVGSLYLFPSMYSARFDYEGSIYKYISSVLYVGSAVALIELAIVFLFHSFFFRLFNLDPAFIALMFFYAMVRPAFELFLVKERIEYNYKKTVAISSIATLSSLSVSVLLVLYMNDKLCARVLGTYIPLIIVCCILYLGFLRRDARFDPDCARYALRIGLPYVPHALAMTVLSSTDRIMITHYCGPTDNALYSIAYTCALAVSLLWSSVNTAFAPWLGEKIHNREEKDIYDFSSKYILIVAIPVMGLIIFAPEMLLVLGGQSYIKAKYVIPPVMAGCFVQFVYSMFVNIEQFMKKTGSMAVASVMGALLNLFLNSIYIPRYGYIAAAYTTLVGYLFLLAAHYIVVGKIGMLHIYNRKSIFLLLSVVLLFSVAVTFTYEKNLIRYGVGVVYLLLLAAGMKKINIKGYLEDSGFIKRRASHS